MYNTIQYNAYKHILKPKTPRSPIPPKFMSQTDRAGGKERKKKFHKSRRRWWWIDITCGFFQIWGDFFFFLLPKLGKAPPLFFPVSSKVLKRRGGGGGNGEWEGEGRFFFLSFFFRKDLNGDVFLNF